METFGVDLFSSLEQLYGRVPQDATLTRLRGDASTRVYYRLDVKNASPATAMVMHLPEDALKSPSGERFVELPFLDVQRFLEQRSIRVPKIYAADVARRVVLLEDLGDETFEARLLREGRPAWSRLYGEAADLLADMHDRCQTTDPSSIAGRRLFDRDLLRWELDHFREWGLEALYGDLPKAERVALDRAFDALTAEIASFPRGFVHRDYQSRNLMWVRGANGTPELAVIDFQDAMRGPRVYDLVALLCDSYVGIDAELQTELIERYATRRNFDAMGKRAFTREFWIQALQRKLKDAGRFVFIDRVRKNADFLQWYAPTLIYVARALEHVDGMEDVTEILYRHIPGFPNHVPTPHPTSPPSALTAESRQYA